MSYFNQEETNRRIQKIRDILTKRGLDAALIYYDELNIANCCRFPESRCFWEDRRASLLQK